MKHRLGKALLALLCAISLSSCRVRTTLSRPDGEGASPREASVGLSDGEGGGEGAPAQGGQITEDAMADASRQENPQAQRKEYSDVASAEIAPSAPRSIHAPGEGEGSGADGGGDAAASRLDENAEDTARQTVAAQEAPNKGVSEEAAAADSALTYYTLLLRERSASLFECKRLTVYWETVEDHVTVYRASPEHALILQAGAYDVSARLLEENLLVDDGWVQRKDPGVIVKIVPDGTGESGAAAARAFLCAREGWEAVDAVRAGRVLILSAQMLEEDWLRTAAALLVAKTANPETYADVDLEEAFRLLAREATGTDPQKTYYWEAEK